jgi:hypothetical protein
MNFEHIDEQGGDTVGNLCVGGDECIGSQSPVGWVENCCIFCSRLAFIPGNLVAHRP